MRILTVGNMYPPHHLGGYELAWQSAVEHARSRGHEVRVLTTDHRLPGVDDDATEDVHRSLRWYWRDHDWPRMGPGEVLGIERDNARSLAFHLDDFRPDVVSFWAMGGMSTSLIAGASASGCPSSAVVCDDWLLYAPRVDRWSRFHSRMPRRLGSAIARRLGANPPGDAARLVDGWIFLSRTVLDRAKAAGFPEVRLEVANPGVDPELFAPAPRPEWGGRLLYAGRIDPRKGIEEAVRSIALLPGATLAVDGGGDERHMAELQGVIGELGLDGRISFTRSPRSGLPAAFAAADAVLFPVLWEEPWGLVPLEAMAVGAPTVASGRGGSGEYLDHERNCLIADPAEGPEGIAAAVRRLESEPDLRERIVAGGRETAARFPPDRFNQAVLEMCEEVAR